MVVITIVTGAYKPTYHWGAPHCRVHLETLCLNGLQKISGFVGYDPTFGEFLLLFGEPFTAASGALITFH